MIPYPDTDGDGIVDGTTVPESTLEVLWYDAGASAWRKSLACEVNTRDNCVKAQTYHLTEFGVWGSRNLLHPAIGGVLDSFTSEFTNTTAAVYLTDGNSVSYWKSEPLPGPQEFVYSFSNFRGAVIHEAVIRNFSESGQGPDNYSGDFGIHVSMDGSNYLPVIGGALAAMEDPQVFGFNVVTCRAVKLVISNGVSAQAWALAEFELHGELTDDPDADGMPDWWEMKHFGSFGRDGTGDYDTDDLSDRMEFELNGDPTLRDTDGDGRTDWQEWIAGTRLDDFASRFEIVDCIHDAGAGTFVIYWDTVIERLYSVYSTSNLLDAWSTNLFREPGTGYLRSYTNDVPAAVNRFFKVGVELAP